MSAIHLFIDTSTFLTFYAYTSDDLEELKKVAGLIKTDKLKLYIPEQVADEFHRNREGKLAESLGKFTGVGVSKAIPRFMADYPEAAAFSEAAKAFQQARDVLAAKAKVDAIAQALPADDVFTKIIEAAGLLTASDALLLRANRRRLRGNPPGKKDSFGDQINWEVLLENVPSDTKLHIVTKDGDYGSALDPDNAQQFLKAEWTARKGGTLHLHRELKPFLNAHFANIKLAVDIEKQIAIDALIYSGSFSATHDAIEILNNLIDDLHWKEVEQIFEAGVSNSQINWIGTDGDVNSFFRKLMVKFFNKVSTEMDELLEKSFPNPNLHAHDLDDLDDNAPF
ncbi:PIN domain-containing protein [Sphingomonas sp. MG17]|uniref:PIN domain-containing protein n=1 Tax=Sphingomonas tagetis TaxID=2949092 RepID=A0A9X2HNQ6_9SPHN|nr:PIN domain-containing protein [Sphingomonas tagetis]MCP3732997.1 PIN domain-containing protein [Sphingomonas tagetis]